MPVADYLKPDTSSQLKSSSEILTEYLKAKQAAALFNASRAAMGKDGTFNERMYRQTAMAGGANPTDAAAGVPEMYALQQKMAIERAREENVRRQAEPIGANPDGSPITAQPGTVDTQRLAVDPGLHAANATSLALDQEQQRVIETQKRNQEAALAALNAQAMGAKPVSGVGTPEANATPVEQTLYNVRGDQSQGGPVEHVSMDVRKLTPDAASDFAYGLRARGLYTDKDNKPGPNMQSAYDRYVAQKYADLEKSKPTVLQFAGDYPKYVAATKAWEAQVAGVPAKIAEEVAAWRNDRQANATSRLGNAATRQGMNIAGKEFKDAQEIVNAAHADKYYGVYKGNAEKFVEAKSAQEWLQKSVNDMASLSERIRNGETISPKEFGGVLVGLKQSSTSADGINTIGGLEQFDALVPYKQETKQALREAKSLGDVVELLAKNEYTTDEQSKILNTLSTIASQQLHSGKNAAYLETLRTRKKPTAHGAISDKILDSIKAPKDIPVAERKAGVTKAKVNGQVMLWNGQGWQSMGGK